MGLEQGRAVGPRYLPTFTLFRWCPRSFVARPDPLAIARGSNKEVAMLLPCIPASPSVLRGSPPLNPPLVRFAHWGGRSIGYRPMLTRTARVACRSSNSPSLRSGEYSLPAPPSSSLVVRMSSLSLGLVNSPLTAQPNPGSSVSFKQPHQPSGLPGPIG